MAAEDAVPVTDDLVVDAVDAPVEAPAEAPAEAPVEEPVEAPVEEPVEAVAEAPAEGWTVQKGVSYEEPEPVQVPDPEDRYKDPGEDDTDGLKGWTVQQIAVPE